ncbi:MAG TPA: YncE family protein [Candidatus Acidoferrales bacterium]|nr:YncE family protein [Candidatus Acidoferrales bacterium]
MKTLAAAAAVVLLAAALPAPATITVIDVGGHPFMALPAADGDALFVSVGRLRKSNGIQVVHRSGDAYTLGQFITIDGDPTGMGLTPDGKTLLVAAGDRYAALSASDAEAGGSPHVAYLQDRFVGGAIEVAAGADGRFAFFTDENDASVGVARIGAAADGTPTLTSIGRVPVDMAPVGITLSPDGNTLFVTSEVAAGHPRSCANGRSPGSLITIDAGTAELTPEKSVQSSMAAGCSPVRVALSPDGMRAWVTQRGDNALASFDVAAMRAEPDRALRSTIRVGDSPVGLAIVRNGSLAYVANSNRFDPSARYSTVDVVDLGTGTVVAKYATGKFPRELRESPQHDAVYLTNYDGGTVEVLPIP